MRQDTTSALSGLASFVRWVRLFCNDTVAPGFLFLY